MAPETNNPSPRQDQESPPNLKLLRAARQRTSEEILSRTAQAATDPRLSALAPVLFVAPFVAPQFLGPDIVPECRYIAR
jgi:hypothetical protein